MPTKTPKEVTQAAIAAGETKAKVPFLAGAVGAFLAGCYVAFGGLLAIMVSSGVPEDTWGTLPLFFRGLVFSLGLILVVIAGSELLTGNMALIPIAQMARRAKWWRIFPNFLVVIIFNFLGSVFVAYVLAVKTGVITQELPFAELEEIAFQKARDETTLQMFLRAMGANWLVCLSVWIALSAEDTGGKILGIIFPILAFVAMGFDHVVANMFFLPAAIFAGIDITWAQTGWNLIFSFLGNFVGAAVFVGGAYYFMYGREPEESGPATGGRGAAASQSAAARRPAAAQNRP